MNPRLFLPFITIVLAGCAAGGTPRFEVLSTLEAPAAIGPYSQGILTNGFVFVAGQIPIDPATGKLVDGPRDEQVMLALGHIEAVLRAAGLDRRRVVQVTLYLTDLADFESVNAGYARFFGEHRPARATVQVSRLPKGAPLEVSAIAVAAAP